MLQNRVNTNIHNIHTKKTNLSQIKNNLAEKYQPVWRNARKQIFCFVKEVRSTGFKRVRLVQQFYNLNLNCKQSKFKMLPYQNC